MLFTSGVLALLALGATADSPVAKVITLLEDLKTEVESEGKEEATSYDSFACFCKDTTKDKSTSITEGEDKIEGLSASIGEDTASQKEKEAEVEKRKEDQEKMGTELRATLARLAKAKADHERTTADTKKAIASLEKAIKAMNAQKDAIKASNFLQLDKDVQYSLVLADARNLVAPSKRSTMNAFIQGGATLDPSDPAYKYHSKEINDILAKLLKDFEDDQKETDAEFEKTEKAITEEQDGLSTKMKDNLDAISSLEEKIEDLKKKIAKNREDLVSAQDTLKDDATYLKDLTLQCEEKAKDFDQRASMRGEEVKALSEALKIIGGKAKDYEDVGKKDKAFVQKFIKSASKVAAIKPVSFLQASPGKPVTNFLSTKLTSSQQEAKEKVLTLLRLEGKRLASPMLSAMVMDVGEDPTYEGAADPFKKAKMLIQKLIERLLEEGHAEAAKKGFCDEEIGKGAKKRDYAYDESKALHADLAELESTEEELEAEMKELKKGIEKTEESLKEATELRDKEKKENLEVVDKATEGLEAVKEAILILKAFYQSAKNAQSFLQASPVDADTSGPGFSGMYHGKQEQSRPIFILLQKIADNFQATIDKTEQSEAEAAATYVKFDRNSKADIEGKETKTKLDKQDLNATKTSIEKKLDDLKIETGLMDDAIKMIEELKPACVDTGMNYQERVEKREQEIAALNHALEILRDAK
jgi:chromosome segregation ATPase